MIRSLSVIITPARFNGGEETLTLASCFFFSFAGSGRLIEDVIFQLAVRRLQVLAAEVHAGLRLLPILPAGPAAEVC